MKVSIALNIILLLLLGVFGGMLITYYKRSAALESELMSLNNKVSILEKQLSYYSSLGRYIGSSGVSNSSINIFGSIQYHAVAVAEEENGYVGIVLNFTISLARGSGRVLVNTQPRIGIDLQTSIQIAKEVAENLTGVDLSKEDIILSIEASRNVDIVDGPSAGAALASALISLILNKTMRSDVYMTGTISPDGSIGQVGGVLEKALAAAENGARIFIVPYGEENVTVYVKHEREVLPGVYVITYSPEIINVEKYLRDKGFNVEVVAVSNIRDILKYIWR